MQQSDGNGSLWFINTSHITNMFFAQPISAGETENTVFGMLSFRSSSQGLLL
jgi:hypothetical protein